MKYNLHMIWAFYCSRY